MSKVESKTERAVVEAKIQRKELMEKIQNRIIEMKKTQTIQAPTNYSFQNALRSAFLILSEAKTKDGYPVLDACTGESISNALLEMVVQGLNPIKKQCYFIPYGDKLTLTRSYFGTIAITKRILRVVDVKAYPVYEADEFEIGFDVMSGNYTIKKFEPNVMKQDPESLVGAFALILGKEKVLHTEYMTIAQIRQAWSRGQTKGKSSAHTEFPDQMAIRTVVNRACKKYANTSDDGDLVAEILNGKSAEEVEAEATEEIMEGEFSEVLEIEPEPDETVEVTAPF